MKHSSSNTISSDQTLYSMTQSLSNEIFKLCELTIVLTSLGTAFKLNVSLSCMGYVYNNMFSKTTSSVIWVSDNECLLVVSEWRDEMKRSSADADVLVGLMTVMVLWPSLNSASRRECMSDNCEWYYHVLSIIKSLIRSYESLKIF